MNKKLKHALYFLRLTDENGLLSITNIGCIVVLIKVALNPNPSIVDMGSLLITLSLYFGKAHMNRNKQAITDENKQAIADIQDKVKQIADKTSGLSAMIGIKTNNNNPFGK